jgi:hypothetical protein
VSGIIAPVPALGIATGIIAAPVPAVAVAPVPAVAAGVGMLPVAGEVVVGIAEFIVAGALLPLTAAGDMPLGTAAVPAAPAGAFAVPELSLLHACPISNSGSNHRVLFMAFIATPRCLAAVRALLRRTPARLVLWTVVCAFRLGQPNANIH